MLQNVESGKRTYARTLLMKKRKLKNWLLSNSHSGNSNAKVIGKLFDVNEFQIERNLSLNVWVYYKATTWDKHLYNIELVTKPFKGTTPKHVGLTKQADKTTWRAFHCGAFWMLVMHIYQNSPRLHSAARCTLPYNYPVRFRACFLLPYYVDMVSPV